MLEIFGKIVDLTSHWPVTLQIALLALGAPLAIWAWRSGALNRDKDPPHPDEDASEARRRIYDHIDDVRDKLDFRIREAEREITGHGVRLDHLERVRRR